MSGTIYKITNTVNTLIYVGQTRAGIHRRFSKHKSDCKRNIVEGLLHVVMKEFGIDCFKIEPIYENVPIDNLNVKEQEAILHYNTIQPNGYNSKKGGGVKTTVSLECRLKHSINMKGRPQHPASGMGGKSHSDETKLKMSKASKGVKKSDVARKNMSGSRKLTSEQVQEIRDNPDKLLQCQLAVKYNVSNQLINNIVRNLVNY